MNLLKPIRKSRFPVYAVGSIAILVFLWSAPLCAQEMPVPVDIQLVLFFKILSFDRNLKEKVGEEILIAVCYERTFAGSLGARNELLKLLKELPVSEIEDVPLRFVSVDISEAGVVDTISRVGADILYVTPLHSVTIETITTASRAGKILTFTGVPDYVESGLAVGIGIKEEKPLIIINEPAAEAEGANFSSQLLKLAKVIE